MTTDELDFALPPDLIAQTPRADRAASRLLHYCGSDRTIAHRQFAELPSLLRAGDLLVFNNAKVTPARFALRKSTGGRVEGLFVQQTGARLWKVMLKNLGTVDPSAELHFSDEETTRLRVLRALGEGEYEIETETDEPALLVLARVGRMPLPPYIKREKEHDDRDDADRDRYQTVYAKEEGSIAAPTAGLHFTPAVLQELSDRGIERAFLTLRVGLGTFKPVSVDDLSQHNMHVERYTIQPDAAEQINRAKRDGRRVIAVGTTSARVLESQPENAEIAPTSGETGIFIYPPYQWRHTDALITNFHLPRSTLIALVAAKIGLPEQRRVYTEAIAQKYRFFSYGDASLLE